MPRTAAARLLVATAMLAGSAQSDAGEIDAISYVLGISTDINLLRDPDDRVNQAVATWKTSSQIALARKTPVFRLTNASDTDMITMFSLDINDPAYALDAIVIAEQPAGMSAELVSPTDSSHGGDRSSTVSFSFADRPLLPSESFSFWLDIDQTGVSSGTGCGLSRRSVGAATDNATVTVDFATTGFGPMALFDFAMQDQLYGTEGLATGASRVFPLTNSQDSIGAFLFTQQTRTSVAAISEPNSSGLMASGVALLALTLVGANWKGKRRLVVSD